MSTEDPCSSATECRIRARRLLKQLRSASRSDALTAAERFRRLRTLAPSDPSEIVAEPDRIQLKHALSVVALESGFPSWRALKAAAPAGTPEIPSSRAMYAPGLDVLLNRWFARYEDARDSLKRQGGYLLPYDRQFFICEPEGIRILGLDPDDPDWQRIGWDWVQPADREAWRRLWDRRSRVLQAG